MTQTNISSLLCEESLDTSLLNKTPEHNSTHPEGWLPWEAPVTVKAIQDHSQIKDVRILQNLLRNEDRFLPEIPDYMKTLQSNNITAEMRKTVANWMLEVIREQNSQAEVFCLSMNILDRFLSQTQIHRSQLQLLGAVCILIASKIREPCPIPGKSLIIYTDYSITAEGAKTAFYREIRPRLQAATHTSSAQLNQCTKALDAMLPEYLRGLPEHLMLPDSTTSESPDLMCDEKLIMTNSNQNSLSPSSSSEHSTFAESEYTLGGSRSSSPLSAVDIFTEFNQNVLQPMYDQVGSDPTDSFTILVS